MYLERGPRSCRAQPGRKPEFAVHHCPVRSDPSGWCPAVPIACGSWRAWQRVGKAEVDMEVEAKVVEEKQEKKKKKNMSLIKYKNPIYK